jgi:hypothetical protein
MPSPGAISSSLKFEPTPAGIARAHEELDKFAASLGGEPAGEAAEDAESQAPASQAPSDDAARTVYRNAGYDTRTRQLLKALPGDVREAVTPTEIAKHLRRHSDGSLLPPAGVRAVMRNVKRIERTLKRRGVIAEDREVLKADWSRYDVEGCGRYYLSAADHEIIQTL